MLSETLFALQITSPLLYSCTLDLTFMVHGRHLFYEHLDVIIGVTPAASPRGAF
jgi:hypothetical protein